MIQLIKKALAYRAYKKRVRMFPQIITEIIRR